MGAAVAFVLKGYPRLSETFIAQEIHALERRGLDIRLFSLRHPTDPSIHPIHREIRAPVTYLPEYLYQQPRRVLRAWRKVRRFAGYAAAHRAWLRDLRRDFTANRGRRFGQALVLAAELPADIGWLHAHFLHTPASVTRYAAMILAMPWSVSAHAKDVWTTPDWEKRKKLADCRRLFTCTRIGAEHLAALAPRADKVELVYHGLDFDRFPPPPIAPSRRDGTDADDPVIVLSVGRAVEKKGYGVLLEALSQLPSKLHWRFVHVGGGAMLSELRAAAERHGIADRVAWLGPLPQERVLEQYRAADLFVLASRVAADGDRDGLPNVLFEAQSQGVACVSTSISAIPELIVDGETGVLVAADDATALTRAIQALICSPQRRAHLGAAGMRRVRAEFDSDGGIDHLARFFGVDHPPVRTCASRSTLR